MFNRSEDDLKKRLDKAMKRFKGHPHNAVMDEKIQALEAELIALKHINLFTNLQNLFGFKTALPESSVALRQMDRRKFNANVAVRYRHWLPAYKNHFYIVLDVTDSVIYSIYDVYCSDPYSLKDPTSIDNLIGDLIGVLRDASDDYMSNQLFKEYRVQRGHREAVQLFLKEIEVTEVVTDALSWYELITALDEGKEKEDEDHR
jgi:hypothetical protein